MSKAAEQTPFARELTNVLNGTAVLESMSNTLVSGAVRETIQTIAARHDLDAADLILTCEADIVARYSAMNAQKTAGELIICAATTRAGTRCSRRAVFNGVCLVHKATASDEADAKKRRIDAYCVQLSRMSQTQDNQEDQENQDPNARSDGFPDPAPHEFAGGVGL